MEAVISTSQAQFGDQFIHVGPSGWIWVNFRDTPPFILCWLMHCCIFLECAKSLWWSNAVTLPPSSPFLLAAWVNLQARPTFCFSRTKQFTTFCKEMSLLPMTTCLHINGALGKEQLLGSHPAASQPCINWTEQPSDSLRKQPTFFNTTTGFPVKWRLRNDCRNFILLRCLGSASDWS